MKGVQFFAPQNTLKTCLLKINLLKAFTLAEILVTLTIIGVVSAMTVPTLMNKVQEHGFRSAMKKKYAEVGAAMIKMNAEEEPYFLGIPYKQNMDYTNNPEIFSKYFKVMGNTFVKNINQLSFNTGLGQIYNKANAYKLTTIDGVDQGGWVFLAHNEDSVAFQLVDGTIMQWSQQMSYTGTDNSQDNQGLIVDVNGLKGPNRAGVDVFYFNIDYNSNYDPVLKPTKAHAKYAKKDCCYGGSAKGWGCTVMFLQNPAYKVPRCSDIK